MTDFSAWPEYMTVTEVAVVMRVSKMTVYRLCSSGELNAIRVGRSFRIPASGVRAYLKMEGAALR